MATINTSPNYDGPDDADNDFMCAAQLQRIATSLEEILRLVKEDQERMKKLNAGSRPMDIRRKPQAASNKPQA